MKMKRSIHTVLALAVICAFAAPAGGARPSQDSSRLFMSEGGQVVVALAESEGLSDVRILGTYSFFACSYGCRADEEVIVFSARDSRSGRIGTLAVCYDGVAQRISRASGRISEHPSCRYGAEEDGADAGNQE